MNLVFISRIKKKSMVGFEENDYDSIAIAISTAIKKFKTPQQNIKVQNKIKF